MSLAQPWQVHCRHQTPLEAALHITHDHVLVAQSNLTHNRGTKTAPVLLRTCCSASKDGVIKLLYTCTAQAAQGLA